MAVGPTENVVPVDHVEEVINRVIVDLGHALYNLKEARYEVQDAPIPEKCITHRDLERTLQMMKLQIVTEIRYKCMYKRNLTNST